MPVGRKRKPAHLRLVDGSHKRSDYKAKVAAEPRASGNLADSPDWLTDEQKASWAYAVEDAPPGSSRKTDRGAPVTRVLAGDVHARTPIRIAADGLGGILAKTPKDLLAMDPLARANATDAGIKPEAGGRPAHRPRGINDLAGDNRPGGLAGGTGRPHPSRTTQLHDDTGGRIGEALALTPERIDPAGRAAAFESPRSGAAARTCRSIGGRRRQEAG